MNINIFMMFATLPPLCRYSKFVRLGKYAVRTPATRTMTGEYCHECGGGKLVVFINTLRPRQDGRHFPDDILKWIFLNENLWISIEISLKFVPKDPINNIPALVQIMAWRRSGDKPLSEPMMVNLLTHICVTWPQWVKAMIHAGNINALLHISRQNMGTWSNLLNSGYCNEYWFSVCITPTSLSFEPYFCRF